MEENTLLYDEILKSGPSESTLHIVLARIKGEGRPHEVVKWCMKFMRVYPKDVHLLMLLGESLLEMGLIGQAETVFERISVMLTDLHTVHQRLAEIYEKQGRFEEAAVQAERFIAHHPEDAHMGELLKRARAARDEMAAGAHGRDQQWPTLPDEDHEALVPFATPTIAELYFNQGQLEAAVETYEKVLLEHPDDSASAARLSQLRAELESPDAGADNEPQNLHAKEEKLLAILGNWLHGVEEMKHG